MELIVYELYSRSQVTTKRDKRVRVKCQSKFYSDPITPDPITPDPITPDPITPDPITPDPITPDPITPSASRPHQSLADNPGSKRILVPQAGFEPATYGL